MAPPAATPIPKHPPRPPSVPLPPRSRLLRAIKERDLTFDGLFVFAVSTTGIFCRPTCPARRPLPRNTLFFPSPALAARQGFRPCKRCHPTQSTPIKALPAWAARLKSQIDTHPNHRISEKDLSALGLDPSTVRRTFLAHLGITFHAYARATRRAHPSRSPFTSAKSMSPSLRPRIINNMTSSSTREPSKITNTTMLPYSSPPAINGPSQTAHIKALDHLWGSPNDPQTPLTLSAQWIDTPLGIMLAIADHRGLQLLDFVDRKNLDSRITSLRLFLSACITHTPHPDHLPTLKKVKTAVDRYFEGTGFLGHLGPSLNIPLASLSSDSDATQFQRSVWNQLLQIPLGQTRTYAQQAAAINRPTATRAVALANSQNYIALLIPCHRVIGSDGSLTGYASGVWRKEWLLAHEVRLASKARELGIS